jgi:hypothetical protein
MILVSPRISWRTDVGCRRFIIIVIIIPIILYVLGSIAARVFICGITQFIGILSITVVILGLVSNSMVGLSTACTIVAACSPRSALMVVTRVFYKACNATKKPGIWSVSLAILALVSLKDRKNCGRLFTIHITVACCHVIALFCFIWLSENIECVMIILVR